MNIKSMTLKIKLIAGFATILALLSIVSAVGFYALNQGSTGFSQYREMARDANLLGRLQANMLMVRMNVKDFIITGSDKDKQQYHDYLQKMEKFLDIAQHEIKDPGRAQKIDFTDVAHSKYDEGFSAIVGLKNQRNSLVNGLSNKNGPKMEKLLTKIMESAEEDGDISAAFHSGLAMKHMLLGRVYVMKFLDTNKQKTVDRVDAEFRKMTELLDVLDNELQDLERRKLLEAVRVVEKEFIINFAGLTDVIFKRNAIIRDTLDVVGPQIAANIDDVKLSVKSVQDEIGPRLQQSNKNAISLIMFISIGALLIGAGIVFYITRSVTNQLGEDPSEIADIAREIAGGNLALTFKTSGGSGSLGVYRDMETMTLNLRKVFSEINAGVATLTSSAADLSTVSEQVTQGVQDVSGKSNTVSAATEKMSSNMNSVAAAMEESATNTNMVAAASEEMYSTISEIAQNAEKARGISNDAAQKASSASTNMEALRTAANSIGKVIETITSISEQVNLLALNATIEAARAGDAGKGFAVVANEIKDLAKMTAEATQDIKEKVEGIQGTTSTTVSQINEITEVISNVNAVVVNIAAAVEQQSTATREIAANVAQASDGIREVNENVNQSSVVTAEISKDIAGVNSSMDEMLSSSAHVNESALALTRLAVNLKQTVDQFKL